MKKAMIAFTTLLSIATPNVFGSFFPYGVYVPCLQERFILEFSGLEQSLNIPQNDYALIYPDDSLEFGRVASVDPTLHFGVSILGGYIFPETGNDVHLTLTTRNGTDTDSVQRPQNGAMFRSLSDINLSTSVFIIFFDVTNPSPPASRAVRELTAPITVNGASARNEVNYEAVDFDLGQYIKVVDRFLLRLNVGFSYAHLEKTLDVKYFGAGDAALNLIFSNFDTMITEFINITSHFDVVETVKQNSFFNGIGPKVGFEFDYRLRNNFGLKGEIGTALLTGHMESLLTEIQDNVTTSTTNITVTPNALGRVAPPPATVVQETTLARNFLQRDNYRVVPELKAKVGLHYTLPRYCRTRTLITVELGYQVNHYFNPVDNLSIVGASRPEVRTNHTQSMYFDGPYFSIQFLI